MTIAGDMLDDPEISITPSYRIRPHADADWELLSDTIHGFEHEPGVETDVEVEITTLPDPPQGGSSLRYDLVRVLAKRTR